MISDEKGQNEKRQGDTIVQEQKEREEKTIYQEVKAPSRPHELINRVEEPPSYTVEREKRQ